MKKGQTMIEYVICVSAVIVIVGIIGYVISAAQKHAHRSTALVASEYP